MYKKILVATMGEYMDEIMEHTMDIIGEKENRSNRNIRGRYFSTIFNT